MIRIFLYLIFDFFYFICFIFFKFVYVLFFILFHFCISSLIFFFPNVISPHILPLRRGSERVDVMGVQLFLKVKLSQMHTSKLNSSSVEVGICIWSVIFHYSLN